MQAPFTTRSTVVQNIAINEIELAQRWGISPKPLQRWRTEGRGPRYFKLSKRVCYPTDQILAFENGARYESTSERCTPRDSVDAKLVSAREAAAAINVPMYLLTHPRVRQSMGVPFVYVGKLVRFKLEEVMEWARRCAAMVCGSIPKRGLELARRLDVKPHPIPRPRATGGRNLRLPSARPALRRRSRNVRREPRGRSSPSSGC